MNCVLHGSPLSEQFRKSIEATLHGPATYLTLAELRKLPLFRLFRELRSLNVDHLVIAYESDSSVATVPALVSLGAFTRARAISVFGSDSKLKQISRFAAVQSLFAMVGATFSGLMHMWHCSRELKKLGRLSRLEIAHRSAVAKVFYAKANLSFGVTAGGSVGHVSGVTSGFLESGYAVDFLSVEPPAVIDPQVQCQIVAPPKHFGLPYESNLYRYHNIFVRDAMRHATKSEHGFIYQRLSIGNYSGVTISRNLNLPLVLEYNGSEVWVANHWTIKHKFPHLAEAAENVSLEHAHVVVTVSDVLRDELVERGVDRERIVTYPNCIDPAIYDASRFTDVEINAVRQRHGIATDAIVIGFVGTFGQWHGVELLANAIRDLALNDAEWLRKHRIHFLLVGDGVRMPEVRQTLSDKLCSEFCTLTGLVPQMETPCYLAAMDILTSPHIPNADGSRFFGSPTKLFEYMAMGRAIIASDLEQIGEVLACSLMADRLPADSPNDDRRELAVLCEPGNVSELKRALKFVVEQDAWRAILGRNACDEASRKYTWGIHVEKILERLTELRLIVDQGQKPMSRLVA